MNKSLSQHIIQSYCVYFYLDLWNVMQSQTKNEPLTAMVTFPI